MATRKQIAERILRVLQGGEVTVDSDIDIREIMLHVDSERDNIIQQKLTSSYKGMRQLSTQAPVPHTVLGHYVSEDLYTTSYDSSRDQRYISLGQYPIDLPDGAGILFIKDSTDMSISFGRISPGTEALYSGLPSFNASKKDYYVWVGDRIYFSDGNPPQTVLLGMVAMSSSLSDTALYPLSPGDESAIVKSVLDLYNLMNTVKQDFMNDNIDQ
jgi:hypothetical protein